MTTKEYIIQTIELLNDSELKKLNQFIILLKNQSNSPDDNKNHQKKIANLYQEFTEEDKLLAEQGIYEYQELLNQED